MLCMNFDFRNRHDHLFTTDGTTYCRRAYQWLLVVLPMLSTYYCIYCNSQDTFDPGQIGKDHDNGSICTLVLRLRWRWLELTDREIGCGPRTNSAEGATTPSGLPPLLHRTGNGKSPHRAMLLCPRGLVSGSIGFRSPAPHPGCHRHLLTLVATDQRRDAQACREGHKRVDHPNCEVLMAGTK